MKDSYKKRVQLFLDQLLNQAKSGVPIEYQGFMTHPEGVDMPTIEHNDTKKRPQFINDDLEGWSAL